MLIVSVINNNIYDKQVGTSNKLRLHDLSECSTENKVALTFHLRKNEMEDVLIEW
jgi:hypothetical protein